MPRSPRLAVLLLMLPSPVAADVPMSAYPECGEPERTDLCPADLGRDWDLISYVREEAQDAVRPAEIELGSGVGLDRALAVSAGSWSVRIAVGDSGLDWSSSDLVDKIFLNVGELPLPQDAEGVEAADHDLDGNGLVNVADYAWDPRVDPNAGPQGRSGEVDAQDLLLAFSDGIDDDGNGYPDDIAGWDFFADDNDPFHTLNTGFGTHGTGVMEDAAAEGDGGGGRIGQCPNCALIPIRVGDTFITDGTRVAEAIVYAADMGAVSLSQAVGAMSAPDSLRAAVQYAWDQGMIVVGAAGDENQYHHNFPGALDDALYVKSLMHDKGDEDGSYSFFNTWNCNNYGPRLQLAAPADACATGATAKITGMVGLLHSAALEHGLQLTPGEVTQLLFQTADDIWLSDEERETAKALPSAEGWDAFHGYGRANIGRAAEWVAAGQIPPEARITSPLWFQAYDVGETVQLEIEGDVRADRDAVASWTLEWGRGADPRTWEALASGTDAASGVLGTLDLDALEVLPPGDAEDRETLVERMERAHEAGVTLRLRVTDSRGLQGESRKHVLVHRDADLLPGFPLRLDGSLEGSPVLADLDGDAVFEIVQTSASGEVRVIDGTGATWSGFPVSTWALDRPWTAGAAAYASGGVPAPRESIVSTAAVGDIDGDGVPEIVAGTLEGRLWAWHTDGSLVDGFPYTQLGRAPEEYDSTHIWDRGFMGAPALADIDGDGDHEIIAGGGDGYIYVVDGDGSPWGPYPVELCHPTVCPVAGARIIASPTVDDVDGDGDLDVLLGSNEGANNGNESVTHGLDLATGQPLPGFPWDTRGLIAEALLLPLIGEGHPASTAVADLDGDGDLEMLDPIMLGQTPLVHHDGSVHAELSYLEPDYGEGSNVGDGPSLLQLSTHPAFGDLDLDGVPDAVIGGSSSLWVASLAAKVWMDGHHPVAAWSGADGSYLPGWPRQIEDLQFLMAPAIAEISGDELPEVIYGSAGHLVHAWNKDGVEPEGWPKHTGQWVMGSPAVGDIDGDGYLDVVVTTRQGYLWAWSTRGRADQVVQWQSIHHDARNTGSYETPLPVQAGPAGIDELPAELKGCAGCGSRQSSETGAALLLLPGLLGLAGLRRRRG